MEKIVRPSKIVAYRTGEVAFLLLLVFYFSGGMPCLPASWMTVLDATPKIYRKLFIYLMAAAVILGLALFEWAKRDRDIGTSCLLARIIGSWKTRSSLWIAGIFVLFGSWWTASSLLRHVALQTSFDMAIFTQAIWNTTQGDWFYSSIKGGICLLGDHFAPLLAVFVLPYRVWPEPGLLLAIQAFAAASCVFPLARIVRKSGQPPSWEVLYCLAFALSLPVRNAVRFDFHPEVAAMPLLLWAFAFLQERKTWLASIFLALALMAKENMATVAFAFGFYAAFFGGKGRDPLNASEERAHPILDGHLPCHPRMSLSGIQTGFPLKACGNDMRNMSAITGARSERQSPGLWGIGWMAFSVCYFFLVTHVLIPKISGAPYAYLDGNFTAWLREGWGPFAKHVFQPSTFEYLTKIYGPLAFSSFFAPASFILTLPTLAQNILSRNEMTRSLFFQYTATLTPFVFISSVMALAKLRFFRRYAAYLILLMAVLMSGGSEVYSMRRQWITITPHIALVKEMLAGIPTAASLRTHEFYASHAANRRELHIYENDNPKEGGSRKAQHADYVAIDRPLIKGDLDADLSALKRDGYQVSSEQDGFYILKKS